jgi:hypothetical protein
VDKKNKTRVPAKFTRVGNFAEGLAAADSARKFGYINPQGETVIPFQYITAAEFRGPLATVSTDSTWGYINRSAKFIWQTKK